MNVFYETNRLMLKLETTDSAENVLDFYMRNKDFLEPFEPTRPPNFYTFSYQKVTLLYEYDQFLNHTGLRYFIYLKKKPNYIIGSLNYSNIKRGMFQSALLGYKLDQNYQSQGYAYEACTYMNSLMFSDLHLHRLEARVLPTNIKSLRLIEKLGFQFEGIEYSSVEINGIWENHYRYSLINES